MRLIALMPAAPAGPLEQCERPIMGVEHHLCAARISPHEQHPTVAEPDESHLHDHRDPLSRITSWLQSNW